MKVSILRGGSGCGKSTWAQKHGDIIVSADFFFVDENKVYQFDIDKLGEAHVETFKKFLGFVQNPPMSGTSGKKDDSDDLHLVVDNTNTSIAEFAGYAQTAMVYGHDVQILTFCYDPIDAYKRNIHGSSLDVCMHQHIKLMAESARMPSWWKHEFVLSDYDGHGLDPRPENLQKDSSSAR